MAGFINLFHIRTEYHLILCTSIIMEYFADSELYKNIIAFDIFNKRLQLNFTESTVPADFIKYNGLKVEFKRSVLKLLNLNPEQFFYFQEADPCNIYLIE